MSSTDKILVAGAGGFVGGKLVEYLQQEGHDVRAVSSRPVDQWLKKFDGVDNMSADLRNPFECARAVEGCKWIYNLAAKVGGIGFIGKHKSECMLSSLINTHLLQAAADVGVAGYFFASSSCVYPENDGTPLKESDAYPANPTDGYGWEKLFSERMCLAFSEEKKVPVRIARYHTLYGPGDVRQLGKDHVTTALCNKVIAAKLSGLHEICIWGDGNQTRSFLYIDDCVEGTQRLMNAGIAGPTNLANSEVVSVNDLVTMLEEIAAVKLMRFYSTAAPQGRKQKITDNSFLRASLGWEPMTPIRTGLERLYRDLWDRATVQRR